MANERNLMLEKALSDEYLRLKSVQLNLLESGIEILMKREFVANHSIDCKEMFRDNYDRFIEDMTVEATRLDQRLEVVNAKIEAMEAEYGKENLDR